jgi:hypothetical protein
MPLDGGKHVLRLEIGTMSPQAALLPLAQD